MFKYLGTFTERKKSLENKFNEIYKTENQAIGMLFK